MRIIYTEEQLILYYRILFHNKRLTFKDFSLSRYSMITAVLSLGTQSFGLKLPPLCIFVNVLSGIVVVLRKLCSAKCPTNVNVNKKNVLTIDLGWFSKFEGF